MQIREILSEDRAGVHKAEPGPGHPTLDKRAGDV